MARNNYSTDETTTSAPLPDYFKHTCGNVEFVIRNAGTYTIKKGERAGQTAQSPRSITIRGIGQDRPTEITPAGILELYILLRDNTALKAEIEKRISEDAPVRTF